MDVDLFNGNVRVLLGYYRGRKSREIPKTWKSYPAGGKGDKSGCRNGIDSLA